MQVYDFNNLNLQIEGNDNCFCDNDFGSFNSNCDACDHCDCDRGW